MAQLPPENEADQNAGQRDEGQAQAVAQDAMNASTDLAEESRHGGRADPAALVPGDVPDLVDRMNEMLRSGHIDNDAYIGEPLINDD